MRDDWEKAKDFFNKQWVFYEEFADKNFLTEIQTNFSQRAWEIYLSYLFQENSLVQISQSKNSPNPDFKIKLNDNQNIFVEAVVAGKGEGVNAVETLSDKLSLVPSGTIISGGESIDSSNHPKVRRILSALNEKGRGFQANYRKVTTENDYFVIAVNAGDIDGSRMPEGLILEAVWGMNPALHLPRLSDGTFGPAYQTLRPSILNSRSTASIDLDFFRRDEYKEISGVIFSGSDVVNTILQEKTNEEIIFVHNPNALPNKTIPMSVFNFLTQITISPTGWTRHPSIIKES